MDFPFVEKFTKSLNFPDAFTLRNTGTNFVINEINL